MAALENRAYRLDMFPVPTIHTAEIAPNLIQDILVNPMADSIWPRDYPIRFNSDFLRNQLVLALPSNACNTTTYSPPHFRRALTLLESTLPLSTNLNHAYRYITAKGVGSSGDYVSTHDIGQSDHPQGYFGIRDADQDMRISNAFLESGIKVGVPLGYVVLEPKELESFYTKMLLGQNESAMLHARIESLRIVTETNKDSLVVYFRAEGSPIRMNHLYEKEPIAPYHFENAMRLMAHEMNIPFRGIETHLEQYKMWLSSHFLAFYNAEDWSEGRKVSMNHGSDDIDIAGSSVDHEWHFAFMGKSFDKKVAGIPSMHSHVQRHVQGPRNEQVTG